MVGYEIIDDILQGRFSKGDDEMVRQATVPEENLSNKLAEYAGKYGEDNVSPIQAVKKGHYDIFVRRKALEKLQV